MRGELIKEKRAFGIYYLSKLRRDSVGADFQSARKLTNYVSAVTSASSDVILLVRIFNRSARDANHVRGAPTESRLRAFRKIC